MDESTSVLTEVVRAAGEEAAGDRDDGQPDVVVEGGREGAGRGDEEDGGHARASGDAQADADFAALMRSLGVEDSDLGEDNPKEG